MISEQRFLANVKEARTLGFEFVCSECGCGIADDSDSHETGCTLDPDPDRLTRHLQGGST